MIVIYNTWGQRYEYRNAQIRRTPGWLHVVGDEGVYLAGFIENLMDRRRSQLNEGDDPLSAFNRIFNGVI